MKLACVLLTIVALGSGHSITDGTTLMQTFLVHRHGDRTPVEDTIALTTDPEAVEAASAKYGYGQLTDVGKRRAYLLGLFIRERYASLLSRQYNKSEIYIRSTDSTRTKMTVLTAMAAAYPSYKGSWSDVINWVPVPYTTVPARYDFNLANINCPTYMDYYTTAMFSYPPSMAQYADVMEVIANVSGVTMLNNYPGISYGFYDAYVSQQSLGIPLGDQIEAIMPRLKEAAGAAMDFIFANENIVKYMGGVFLNEFVTYSSIMMAGNDTPRVRIYSAHDINVFSIEASVNVTQRQGVPKYASSVALELRRVDKTGQHVVLVVYKPDPSEEIVYLSVEGCDSILCDVEQFYEAIADNLLDEDTWRAECGYTVDLVIDDSSIA